MPPIVFFDQSERKIDSRTGTGRRIKHAVLNEMPSGIDTQVRKTDRNFTCATPMSGDFTAVKQTSWRHTENSTADRSEPPSLVSTGQDPVGDACANGGPPQTVAARNHDCIELRRGFRC